MNAGLTSEYGLYGKIPAFADFVTRRLPLTFVMPWDHWLRAGMAASRQALGEGWLDAYLTSPPWRFAIDPGVAGPSSWVGLVASSVDEVRRAYPITLAMAVPQNPCLMEMTFDCQLLLDRLESVALGLIEGTLDIEAATGTLAGLRTVLREPAPRPRDHIGPSQGRIRIGTPSRLIPDLAGELGPAGLEQGCSLWWHAGWGQQASTTLLTEGLPQPADFANFLDQRWTERGWRSEGGSA